MRIHSSRKLFLFGRYSLALLLPKKWLTEMGVKRGELVTMEYDRRREKIVLRFDTTSNNRLVEAIAPAKLKTTNLKKTDSESTDLQPIPEL